MMGQKGAKMRVNYSIKDVDFVVEIGSYEEENQGDDGCDDYRLMDIEIDGISVYSNHGLQQLSLPGTRRVAAILMDMPEFWEKVYRKILDKRELSLSSIWMDREDFRPFAGI